MTLKNSSSPKNLFSRTGLLLVAGVAVVAMTLVSGESKAVIDVPASDCLVLDAGAFGSSAGQASVKAGPTTWSSRSNVRWNARWSSEGRYLV